MLPAGLALSYPWRSLHNGFSVPHELVFLCLSTHWTGSGTYRGNYLTSSYQNLAKEMTKHSLKNQTREHNKARICEKQISKIPKLRVQMTLAQWVHPVHCLHMASVCRSSVQSGISVKKDSAGKTQAHTFTTARRKWEWTLVEEQRSPTVARGKCPWILNVKVRWRAGQGARQELTSLFNPLDLPPNARTEHF